MAGTSRFPRQHRLRSKVEFDRVFERNSRSSDAYFSVLARPNETGHARLGLAESKKAAPDAVDRNRIKRLVREHFRNCTALPALDFVVSARSACRTASAVELRASIAHHWLKVIERCARF
jgi:ribonuclease P protein component